MSAILDHRGSPMRVHDGLANALTGAGSTVDRRTFDFYNQTYIDEQQILASYRTSWLMRKAVDLPAGDMTRAGRDWQVEKARIADIEAAEKKIGLWAKLRAATTLGRLGGGAIIIGSGRGTASDELKIDQVGKGDLRYLHVVSRFALQLGPEDTDLESATFGGPQWFKLNGKDASATIHPSRVICFHGLPVPRTSIIPFEQAFWGDPLYQAIIDSVTNADKAQNGFAGLIDMARTVDWGIKNLNQRLLTEPGADQNVQRQIAIVEQGVSLHRARIHDAEEVVDTHEINWTGMPDIAKMYLAIVAGAADIPATRLLGKSPDGMNATGEGDERNYLMSISDKQETVLRPALDRLDQLILGSAGIAMDDLDWRFAPLSTLTEAEAAEIASKKATTASTYVNSGLIPVDALAKAVVNGLVEDGTYPGLDDAIDDLGEIQPDGTDPSAITEPDNSGKEVDQPSAGGGGVRPPLRRAANDARFQDATPRTLYVQRKLLNTGPFIAWAKGQGFETTTPPDELHVTIAFSRTPVDWMKMGTPWEGNDKGELIVQPGGARIVEALGDKGAVVLLFASSSLSWRHEDMKQNGASFDFIEYQPHVTITYSKPDGLDLRKVEPYRGELRFGPELFSEVVDDWEKGLVEE